MSTAGPDNFPKPMVSYFATITLSPSVLALTAKKQLKITYHKIIEFYLAYCNHGSIGCVEFTKTGNIHYHFKIVDMDEALILFMDSVKKIRYQNKPAIGFTKIDLIKTDNGVLDYISKDNERTAFIYRKMGIELAQYPIQIVWRHDLYKSTRKAITLNNIIVQRGIPLDDGLDDSPT